MELEGSQTLMERVSWHRTWMYRVRMTSNLDEQSDVHQVWMDRVRDHQILMDKVRWASKMDGQSQTSIRYGFTESEQDKKSVMDGQSQVGIEHGGY